MNPEKLMKNVELISLRGGTNCWCFRNGSTCGITGTVGSASKCDQMCEAQGCPDSSWTGY
jgi:hypothetical protein